MVTAGPKVSSVMRVMLAAIVLGALVAGHVPVRAQQSASDAALHLRIAQRAVEDGEFEIALDEVREAAKIAPTDQESSRPASSPAS